MNFTGHIERTPVLPMIPLMKEDSVLYVRECFAELVGNGEGFPLKAERIVIVPDEDYWPILKTRDINPPYEVILVPSVDSSAAHIIKKEPGGHSCAMYYPSEREILQSKSGDSSPRSL